MRSIITTLVGVTCIALGVGAVGTGLRDAYGSSDPAAAATASQLGAQPRPPRDMRVRAIYGNGTAHTHVQSGGLHRQLDMFELRCLSASGTIKLFAQNAAGPKYLVDSLSCTRGAGTTTGPRNVEPEYLDHAVADRTYTVVATGSARWRMFVYEPKPARKPIDSRTGLTLDAALHAATATSQYRVRPSFGSSVYVLTSCSGSGYVTVLTGPGAGVTMTTIGRSVVRQCDRSFGSINALTEVDPCGGCHNGNDEGLGPDGTAVDDDRFRQGLDVAVIPSPDAGFVRVRIASVPQ